MPFGMNRGADITTMPLPDLARLRAGSARPAMSLSAQIRWSCRESNPFRGAGPWAAPALSCEMTFVVIHQN